jgi:hypothetical protein
VQGSWSKKTLRHFCPFPAALVSRILAISTKKGDLVLDPFSGTGSVVAIAAASNRLGVGIELNPAFVKTFNTSGYDAFVNEIKRTRIVTGGKSLSQLLQKLRLLKYPKSLFVQIARDDRIGAGAEAAIAAFVVRDPRLNHAGNVWAAARVDVLINNSKEASRIQREISTCVTVPPLSKFGVKIDIHVLPPKKWNSTRYRASLKKEFWYRYANGRFYQFNKKIRKSDLRFVKSTGRLTQNRKYPDIVSSLPLQLASFD